MDIFKECMKRVQNKSVISYSGNGLDPLTEDVKDQCRYSFAECNSCISVTVSRRLSMGIMENRTHCL